MQDLGLPEGRFIEREFNFDSSACNLPPAESLYTGQQTLSPRSSSSSSFCIRFSFLYVDYRAEYQTKERVLLQKSPMYTQMRPLYAQKSPVFMPI